MMPATLLELGSYTCFFCEICKIFNKNCFEEHLPTDAFTNERQQETHALLVKKNESNLVNLSRRQSVLPENYSYLNSTLNQRCSVIQFYPFG